MSIAKIFGWLLLLVGLAVIVYSLYSSYSIFAVKKSAPEIFETNEENLQQVGSSVEEMLQEQVKGIVGQILPDNSITGLLNLIAWSIFAGILIFGGGKISGLGIRLIKKT